MKSFYIRNLLEMKTIKAILSTLLIVCGLSGILFSACKKEDKTKKYDLEIETAITGLQLPQNLKDNSTLTQCYYSEKTLNYQIEISKERLADMKIEKKQSEIIEKLRNDITSSALKKKLIDAGASVRYVYFNDKDTVILIITPEDLTKEQ